MNKCALVTGGAGFIGSHLVEHLLESGWKVRVLDDLSTGTQANLAVVIGKIEFIQGSVTDSTAIEQAMTGVETVFHVAAKVFVPESFEIPAEYKRVNVHGTIVLLTAARKAGVRRIVFSSTCAVYGDTTALPIAETALTKPLSPYAVDKLEAEKLGRKAAATGGAAFTALRYFNVYGPRQNPRSAYSGVISRFADALAQHQRPVIYGSGEQTRDFIHVRDVAHANLLAAMSGEQIATYNLGTGRETSIAKLHALMAEAFKSSTVPQHLPERLGDVARSVADVGKIGKVLNFKAETFIENGIRELLSRAAQGAHGPTD
jgi:UDP-glucose 4-epimerase